MINLLIIFMISVLKTGICSDQIWTSSSDPIDAHVPCVSCNGEVCMAVCQEKYYTLTDKPVTFGEAAGECDSICSGSSVWCPESQSEINDVYPNLVVLNYQYEETESDLNWGKLEEDGMSLWTGIKFDEREHITKDLWPVENKLDRFYCSDNLTFDTFNYTWDKSSLIRENVFSENYGDEYHSDEHKGIGIIQVG